MRRVAALAEARKRKASPAVVDAAAVLLVSAWIELGEIEAATRALDEAQRESAQLPEESEQ